MKKICVIGLGYVGLPVAVNFGLNGFRVVGFDISKTRIEQLKGNNDITLECEEAELKKSNVHFTFDDKDLAESDFYIITVPTPIDSANRPDLSYVISASETVAKYLKKEDIVVYESTVYPGATEEIAIPVLEKISKSKCNKDFFVGYSPERINPGDKEHRFDTITKVVSGSNEYSAEIIAQTYSAVVTAGVYRAKSIKIAEASKVIENTQRDINIGFMNELSHIFKALDIDTFDVLEAAGTKWNFLNFKPGLVGGHCISVDPFYLTYQAERHGYHPQVILSGRNVNDSYGKKIAQSCVKLILKNKLDYNVVTILGASFKENVPDIRNSKVFDIVKELKDHNIEVQISDIHASHEEVKHEYDEQLIDLDKLKSSSIIILAVAHDHYKAGGFALIKSLTKGKKVIVMDLKGVLPRENLLEDIILWRP